MTLFVHSSAAAQTAPAAPSTVFFRLDSLAFFSEERVMDMLKPSTDITSVPVLSTSRDFSSTQSCIITAKSWALDGFIRSRTELRLMMIVAVTGTDAGGADGGCCGGGGFGGGGTDGGGLGPPNSITVHDGCEW